MVVVIIIAIMVSLIGIRINRDNDRIARLEAKRFIAIVNEVRDEAVLTGRVYALQFNQSERSYQFYKNPSNWTQITEDRLFKPRQLPEGIDMEVTVEKIENDKEESSENEEESLQLEETEINDDDAKEAEVTLRDYALISPVGDMTPFVLIISGDDYRYQLMINDEQVFVTKRLE